VWSAIRRHGATAFGLLLLVGALYIVQREFRGLSWRDISEALDETSPRVLLLAAAWTVLAYVVLTAYDRLGSVYAGHPVSYLRTSLAAFCAYSLANNLGFATVSGAAVRYRFYAAWGLPAVAIAKIVAFTSLTFGLGGFALGGTVLIFEPDVLPYLSDNVSPWAMRAIGILLWLIVAAYILLSRFVPHFRLFGHRIDLPGLRMALMQTALASADVAVTALIFYALLPPAEGLPFLKFLGIYVAAYTAGIAANVPGGIGVFDGAIMLGLSGFLPAPQVVGALLLFRLYYYIVPLFLAGGLFAAFEISQRRHVFERLATERGVAISFEVPVLAGLTGLAGLTLLFIGALPPKPTLFEAFFGLFDEVATHFAASVVGSLLLVAAYGLVRRLEIAWWSAHFLLLLAAAIAGARGESWWLTGAFLLVILLLATSRGAFYRHARLTTESLSDDTVLSLGAAVICALTLATVAYGRRYADLSWWGVVLSQDAPASLRFTVGLAGVLLLVAAVRLLRPARLRPLPYDEAMRARLLEFGAAAPGKADGAVLGEAGRAGFAFVKRGNIWLGLGDPAGDERDRVSAIWRFRDLCERARADPAFWNVGSDLLRVYGDVGLTAFALPRQPGAPPRYLACRAERDLQALLPLLPAEGAVSGAE